MTPEDSDSGFTLIEVLVALSLISLAFTVLFAAVSFGSGKIREARRETAGLAWVQGAIDAAIAVGAQDLPEPGHYNPPQVLTGIPPLPDDFARAEVVIREVAASPALKEVTVSLYHQKSATIASLAVSTFVAPRPGP